MKKFNIYTENNITEVIIKNGSINNLLNTISKKSNYFLIIDKKIFPHIKNIKNLKSKIIFINGSEKIKNIKNYHKICEQLLEKKINRNSHIIAIGGGTIGDVVGFVASTILRGVKFTLVPTTLLSQVDSSVGGKNGINTKHGKNLIGTFYQPIKVIIDTDILKTLPKREIKSGYAEIIKHALIYDFRFFNWLDKNIKAIINLESKVIEKAIYKSLMIKSFYVRNDTKEELYTNRSRAILNFGHSIGHALEAFYNYKNIINHGEAISVGMLAESYISKKLGYLSEGDFKVIENHFLKAGLKTKDLNIKNRKIYQILKTDKKNVDKNLNFILLKKIGRGFVKKNLNINEINKIIKNIY